MCHLYVTIGTEAVIENNVDLDQNNVILEPKNRFIKEDLL